MSNKNKEAFEQMRRLTKEAKKFYAHNYNPGSLYPPRDTKFFLNEEYIPFDFETAYDDPLYKEYRRVRMLQDPFEDEKEEYNKQDREDKDTTTDESSYDNIKPAKGITDYFIDNLTDIAYGADRALSGATFGGYDWLKKKSGIGIDEDKYLKHKQQTDGSDMAARIGGTIAEIGGNIMGGGGALVKGLSQAGLSGAKLATASGAIGGGLYGISSSNSLSEMPYDAAVGSLSGGVLGGLSDVGMRAVGRMASPYVKKMFNIPKNTSKQTAYNDFIQNNAADEMVDFTPSLEQLKSIYPESGYNPNMKISKQHADTLLRNRADMQNMAIFNDSASYMPQSIDKRLGINHFLGTDRRPFIRTLNNTLNYPDIKFLWDNKMHYIKKYHNKLTNHDICDLVITKDNQLFNKFATNENFVFNKLKGAQDLSLKAPMYNTLKPTNGVSYSNNIPLRQVVVNPDIRNITNIYEGLNAYQAGSLDAAIEIGASRSANKVGSLEHINKVKEALDDMITSPTNAYYRDSLIEVKNRIDEILQTKANKILRPYNAYENFVNSVSDKMKYIYPYIGGYYMQNRQPL